MYTSASQFTVPAVGVSGVGADLSISVGFHPLTAPLDGCVTPQAVLNNVIVFTFCRSLCNVER